MALLRLFAMSCFVVVMVGTTIGGYLKAERASVLDMVAPEFSVDDRGLTEAIRVLGGQYGLQFGIEIITELGYVEPKVSVHAVNRTVRQIIDNILAEAHFNQYRILHSFRRPSFVNIVIGKEPEHYEMYWLVDLESHCKYNAYNLIVRIPRLIPELKGQFLEDPRGGYIESLPEGSEGKIDIERHRTPLRDLLDDIALKQAGLDWVVIYYRDAVAKSEWKALF